MTGIADLYIMLKKSHSKQARDRFMAMVQRVTGAHRYDLNRFVVLSWKRTGSNLFCGILFNHPEILMHNELFNPVDIFTYYQHMLVRNEEGDRWNALGRDLYPGAFLEHVWTGKDISGIVIKEGVKTCGFKSFPDHWWEAHNNTVFNSKIMDDFRVKKVVLFREDELEVYISMKRAEMTGIYMTVPYPVGLKIHVDPAAFQIFINNYRDTFRRWYKSSLQAQDTFLVSYEQLVAEEHFEAEILPALWDFLGVDRTIPMRRLRETVKQSDPKQAVSDAIDNYEELEFCFRHTDVKHFKAQRELGSLPTRKTSFPGIPIKPEDGTWSILLPICSRTKQGPRHAIAQDRNDVNMNFDANRFHELAISSQYKDCTGSEDKTLSEECWRRLKAFADSLRKTCATAELEKTECVVGIDVDDPVFRGQEEHIRALLTCKVQFVEVTRKMYGRVCRIWNHLGSRAKNDYVVLLGDDVVLMDEEWQRQVIVKFHEISQCSGLPFGAACVALTDESFPGFPTFPVVHRWHINKFGTVLPRQFVNQGGDPYLYELYSRFNASSFVPRCRLTNTIGGDGTARYMKHDINWKGQILRLNLMHLSEFLGNTSQNGICLDVVVPSYRTNNKTILKKIVSLGCSVPAYVRFWLVVDNPDEGHRKDVLDLAAETNEERFSREGNYFVSVLHYSENRGASFARNFGFNFSTADWVLFIDDDVTPSDHILDAYIGAIRRYPKARVFVGNTQLPVATNTWTKMLRTCNIMFSTALQTISHSLLGALRPT